MKFQGEIKKLNLFALNDSKIIFTLSLGDLFIYHKTEPYVQKFYFHSERLIIIDTSDLSGPHPIVIDLKKNDIQKQSDSEKQNFIKINYPLFGSYTSFKSDIMKYK